MPPPRVSIVLVNWNNFNDSAECLESLKHTTYPNHETIVIDNGSDGDDARLLRERFGDSIRLIENERNQGFAGGCNIGIQDALDRGADYVVLLNNDTVVTPDFLDKMVEVARNDGRIGIAGGKIYCYEAPEQIWFAGGIIDYRTGKTPIRGSGEADRGQLDEQAEVDWICSCFMFISREVLETVGLLDERFFFGWEDADFCVRAARSGYKVLYVPESRIWHKGWGEAKRERLKGQPLYYATRGHFIFLDKHLTRPRFALAALYFLITLPKVIWDYSRITGQWRGSYYILRAILDFLRMKYGKRTRP
ncbi:MAG TPA: glycosyltransferase family 2 protein [Dehalococcoidia bacterium]|nr:glycosyltransferase family 2 protein [Dehalococcoidia bacterium]